MKTLITLSLVLSLGSLVTFSLANPEPLGTWQLPDSESEELYIPEYDQTISNFDKCFSLWDGYLSSVKSCIFEAYDQQEAYLLDIGFDEENLAILSNYWRDICSKAHSDAHELSRLGFLECFYNGRNSWNED
jgi:hypothetical protein